MRRREFIALLGNAVAFPLTATAQPTKRVRRIGAILASSADDPRKPANVGAFTDGLRTLGWEEGRNIQIEFRFGGVDFPQLRGVARELVKLQLEVIAGVTTRVAAALQQETRTIPIPIVFLNVSDPVGSGFVLSLSRPGENMTGFIDSEASLGGKWIELIKECAPGVKRVYLMLNPDTAPPIDYYMPSLRASADGLGIELMMGAIRSTEEIRELVSRLASIQENAIAVMPDSFPGRHRDLIVALVKHHRVPTIYPWRYMTAAGGLISYGVDPVDAFRKAPAYVDRILKGEKPEDLPVQQPTKFELIVNLKTAKELGLEVPSALLARADEVIE
jgi:putative tryptophan/tyrosine transport system substrate-binding protein